VFAWRAGRALEDELFLSLPDAAILGLIEQAIDLHGDNVIEGHISSRSTTGHDLNSIRMESLLDGISLDGRRILGDAATIRKAGWFKSVSRMEAAAYDHASVNLEEADEAFAAIVESIFTWCSSARR
jgi:putative ATP-dependent endonuclease of OLD family